MERFPRRGIALTPNRVKRLDVGSDPQASASYAPKSAAKTLERVLPNEIQDSLGA